MEFSGEKNEFDGEKPNLRDEVINIAESGNIDEFRLRIAVGLYRQSREIVISETFKGELFKRAQIEFALEMAFLYRDAKLKEYELDELEDALIYAQNMGFDDLEVLIKSEIGKVNELNRD